MRLNGYDIVNEEVSRELLNKVTGSMYKAGESASKSFNQLMKTKSSNLAGKSAKMAELLKKLGKKV
jgi:hypothetical protein